MLWLVTWIAVFAIAALGVVASANSLRFRRRVASEARHLYAGPNEPFHIDRTRLQELPPSVRRYLARAIGSRDIAVRTARLGHGGVFRTKLDGPWLPIRGEQYFSAAPPGFVWWGRIRIAPGLWVDARDRSVEGVGSMRILLESTFALGDSSGAELDQGALLRLLGEMVWLPTSLADGRYVSWSALDEGTAEARLRVDAREVSAVFEFGADGLPARVSADRYRDMGRGKAVLTRWSGEYRNYREVEGMLVPFELASFYFVEGKRKEVLRFQVDRLEYDQTSPF